MKITKENKAIFLDRDGVINKEVSYLSNPDNFEFIEGSIDALKNPKKKGFLLIVVTNQAGIARGIFTLEILKAIHDKMRNILKENNANLDEIYYCPHHPDFTGPCDYRKPNPGMILKAQSNFNINLSKSYMVGDTLNDIETGKVAKCKTVLVLTGYGKEKQKKKKKKKNNKTIKFAKAFPNRFFNMGIAEQNMLGTALGFAISGKIPVVSGFSIFTTGRAWEFIRMACHDNLNVKIITTHSGFVGEDGSTHNSLEDITLMATLPNLTVLVPMDNIELEKMFKTVIDSNGPFYVRLPRGSFPIIHNKNYEFKTGQSDI